MLKILEHQPKNSSDYMKKVLKVFSERVTESEFKKLRILMRNAGGNADNLIRDTIQQAVSTLLQMKERNIDKKKILYEIHLNYKDKKMQEKRLAKEIRTEDSDSKDSRDSRLIY